MRNKKGNSPFTDIFLKLIDGMTRQEVADKVGVSRQNVGLWIRGKTVPDIYTLSKIADAFKVSTDYLLGRTNVKNPAGWSAEKEELMAELTKCRNMIWTVSNDLWNLSHKAIGVLPNERKEPDENT